MASEPRDEKGAMYHIGLKRGDVGRIALLPGDPDRVSKIAERFTGVKHLSSHREYVSYGGYVGREYVIAISTGIGGPSAAICVEELARLGAKVLVRVGTCGAIVREVKVGSTIIADASVRMEGTSYQYVPKGYPAAASPEVVMALREEAKSLGVPYSVGLSASTDSFYAGQGRPSFGGYYPSDKSTLIDDLRMAKVLGFEMESATLFTLARIFGLKAGAIFAVVGNRVSNDFKPGAGEDRAINVAVGAIRRFRKFGV